MKNLLTKKNILIFFLGMFTMFLIEIVLDWDSFVKAFEEGVNAAESEVK